MHHGVLILLSYAKGVCVVRVHEAWLVNIFTFYRFTFMHATKINLSLTLLERKAESRDGVEVSSCVGDQGCDPAEQV